MLDYVLDQGRGFALCQIVGITSSLRRGDGDMLNGRHRANRVKKSGSPAVSVEAVKIPDVGALVRMRFRRKSAASARRPQ